MSLIVCTLYSVHRTCTVLCTLTGLPCHWQDRLHTPEDTPACPYYPSWRRPRTELRGPPPPPPTSDNPDTGLRSSVGGSSFGEGESGGGAGQQQIFENPHYSIQSRGQHINNFDNFLAGYFMFVSWYFQYSRLKVTFLGIISRAGHAATRLRQRDHVIRTQNCWFLHNVYIRFGYSIQTPRH